MINEVVAQAIHMMVTTYYPTNFELQGVVMLSFQAFFYCYHDQNEEKAKEEYYKMMEIFRQKIKDSDGFIINDSDDDKWE